MILIIMGVSGCGKTTVGKQLAHRLDVPFYDGDDFHPPENILKMQAAHPLNDSDRAKWLTTLAGIIQKHLENADSAVIACSALKEQYRQTLNPDNSTVVRFIYLEGSYHTILNRMNTRREHFMPTALLQSQFNDLEPPKDALAVNIDLSVEAIVDTLEQKLKTLEST